MANSAIPGAAAGNNNPGGLRDAALTIKKIRLAAQRELEMAKQVRLEAQHYQQATEAKARSQAQQLILKTRLAAREAIQTEIETHIQGDFEELVNKALADVQKTLADIRAIRITAQEELATIKKLVDAAKIYSMDPMLHQEESEEAEAISAIEALANMGKKQLSGKK